MIYKSAALLVAGVIVLNRGSAPDPGSHPSAHITRAGVARGGPFAPLRSLAGAPLVPPSVPGTPIAQPAAQQENMIISLDSLRQRLDAPGTGAPAVIAVDRDQATFARGHIPTARFLSHQATLDHDGHRLLKPADLARVLSQAGARDDAPIVLYGDDPLSLGWLYMALASIGHADHTSVLDGNVQAWRAAGHPVTTDILPPTNGTLTVRAAPEMAVDRAWVRNHLEDQATKLLDVRSPREWEGGTIPNSTPVRWQDLYTDVKLGRLKTAAGLREVFDRAGVKPGQTVVTYCAVGMRASLALFAARVAGFPARVYVGSWADWTADPSSPIARGR